jgi:prevent-host-death family protein
MTSVGVRELRQRASELLRLVENGETVEVTDRGRPVALLTPIPELDGLERLKALGEVDEATGDGTFEPIELPPGSRLPSEVLAELRHDER